MPTTFRLWTDTRTHELKAPPLDRGHSSQSREVGEGRQAAHGADPHRHGQADCQGVPGAGGEVREAGCGGQGRKTGLPFVQMNNCEVLNGDCWEILKGLPDNYIHCCVTSPPYWGLRDYGVDGQLGLEATPDEYVARMVQVFREVRRVLRDDGTLWLNLGDSYSGSGKGPAGNLGSAHNERHLEHRHSAIVPSGLKHKDLVGIPWRVAFALQADGWWLRQDIIWHKPNPMPESVKDRCTKSHEYIFLLSKQAKYYYDGEAIKVPIRDTSAARLIQNVIDQKGSSRVPGKTKERNKRNRKTRSRLQRKLANHKADKKSTHSVRRLLKRLGKRISNRNKTFSGVVAKTVCEWAKPNSILVFEELTGIKKKKKQTDRKGNIRKSNEWNHRQIRMAVEHKAKFYGHSIHYVNPAFTSQTCSRCGIIGNRMKHSFSCVCGHKEHADINASKNIRNRFTILRSSGDQTISPEALVSNDRGQSTIS